ncbi:hypothetical protein A2592_00325 [Candidatus Kaiserbacteria bacterium RIFOXYD1_FULL_42_15]|uniref:Zinc finger DksA/TraR C4-type domain-containing protein n=1 Tax=Candidatus Kaiserbacteria bacterium RIFOXYD1_FULL_42_15 TaxID=1798532 RepID=A0A1F6FRT8_9BACT|nr:MAG: hypothetical protein A2592_00325 [Candidatus Kaiserbacteria bacterium RIFOXYD1_FULL_42_15]
MNNIEIFASKLAEQKQAVMNELKEIAIHHTDTDDWEVRTDDIDQTDADENLRADDVEDADERVATLAELETRYHNIVRALNKIENGSYGICEVCNEPIEPERLDANPAARTCLTHLDEESSLPLA